jgi:hypothetical protein
MRNYQTAIDATNTALNSNGSASKENARYMESMEGKLQNLKSAWENFSRTMVNSDLLKTGIDALTKSLDFLATDAGQSIIKLGVAFAGAYIAAKPFMALFSGVSALKNMSKFAGITRIATRNLKGGKTHIDGATKGITRLSKAAGKSAPALGKFGTKAAGLATVFSGGAVGWGLLGAAGITAGILALNKAVDGDTDPEKKYQKAKDKLDELKKSYAGVKKEIEEIEKVGKKRKKEAKEKKDPDAMVYTKGEERRLALLKQQEAVLKEQLELKQKLADDKWEKKTNAPQTKSKEVKDKATSRAAAVGKGSASILKGNEVSMAKQLGHTNKLTSAMKDYEYTLSQVGAKYEQTGKISDKSMGDLKSGIEKVKDEQKEWVDHFGSLDKMPEKYRKIYDESKKVTDAYDKLDDIKADLAGKDWGSLSGKELKNATQTFKDLGSAIGVSVDESGELDSINYGQFVSGLESAGFTADQTKDALIQLGEQNPDVKVNIDGVEVAGAQVEQCIDFLDKLNGNDPKATVTVDGVDYAVEDIGSLENYMRLIGQEPCEVTMEMDDPEDVLDRLKDIEDMKLPPKTQEVTGDNADAEAKISEVKNDNVPNKTSVIKGNNSGAKKSVKDANSLKVKDKTLTVKGKKDSSFTSAKSSLENTRSKSVTLSVVASISSTAQKIMAKLGFAQGTKNAPEGLAEVNEQGYEFIRDAKTGRLRIAGGGQRTITHLNEGDIVYTHAESKRMVSDKNDIVIPQHSSGTNKKQKEYDKAKDKILKQYDNKIDEKEHLAKVKHWTDEGLQKQKEKVWKAFNKKLKAENKKWKGVKLTKSLGRERLYSKTEGRADINHEKAITAIENAIENLSRKVLSKGNIKNAKAVVDKYKKIKWISADEQKEYKKQIDSLKTEETSDKTKSSIEAQFENLNYGGSQESLKKAINKAFKKGKITAQEQAEYLKQLSDYDTEKKREEAKQGIESSIDKITTEQSLADVTNQINQAAKNKQITTEEKEELLKQAAEKYQDYQHEQATKNIEDFLSGSRGTNQDLVEVKKKIQEAVSKGAIDAEEQEEYLKQAYKQNADYNMKMFQNGKVTYANMQKMIKQYYNEGKLSAAEYYDYLEQLAQEQFEKEKERIEEQKGANDNKYSLAKAYVSRQIELLQKEDKEKEKTEAKQERENRLQEEQNKLIEAQNELMKAKSKLVKVYREGRGFVYEKDAEAIKEATDALKEQQRAVADIQKEIDEAKQEEIKNEQIEEWQAILDMFDEAETLANIKELENEVGGTAAGLFGGMGTDINKWTAYIKDSLATSLGLSSVIDAMSEITDYTDMLAYLQGNGTVAQSKITAAINKNRFASGTLNSPAGLARVAEQGYEIALLGKGDAVMPHNVSRNLMDWGAYSPHDFAKVMNGEGKQVSYNFDKLVLPNVSNANDFIRELNRLPNKALQFGTSRV